ncbi:LysM peptidoglycan-binding domain-containing protein [Aeromicrobium sp.]|nr:LysM peptidoglycan-binding domain-containing protein [Candidatus Saccharibacteria bacterium]
MSKLQNQLQRKIIRRRVLRAGFVALNALLLVGISFTVLHTRGSGASAVLSRSVSAEEALISPLDQVSSADIAVTVSRLGGMAESTAIKNQSDSDGVQAAAAPITNNVVAKPQVSATTFKSNKDIKSYTAVAGDTVTSIAAKFSVTSDSIKWSNSLTSDTIAAGTKLTVPPMGLTGIVYTVKAGDTVDTIAAKYSADKAQLIAANDAEITGIKVGEQIIIPNGQQPVVKPAPVYSAAANTGSGFAWGGSAIYGYNGYDYGYCTWYVAQRRAAIGNPVPANLGNASSWGYIARGAGMPTGSVPKQSAAVVTSTRGEGHVAFVEAVNEDGSVFLSEMNTAGWAVKSTKTISAAQAAGYTYIY